MTARRSIEGASILVAGALTIRPILRLISRRTDRVGRILAAAGATAPAKAQYYPYYGYNPYYSAYCNPYYYPYGCPSSYAYPYYGYAPVAFGFGFGGFNQRFFDRDAHVSCARVPLEGIGHQAARDRAAELRSHIAIDERDMACCRSGGQPVKLIQPSSRTP